MTAEQPTKQEETFVPATDMEHRWDTTSRIMDDKGITKTQWCTKCGVLRIEDTFWPDSKLSEYDTVIYRVHGTDDTVVHTEPSCTPQSSKEK